MSMTSYTEKSNYGTFPAVDLCVSKGSPQNRECVIAGWKVHSFNFNNGISFTALDPLTMMHVFHETSNVRKKRWKREEGMKAEECNVWTTTTT